MFVIYCLSCNITVCCLTTRFDSNTVTLLDDLYTALCWINVDTNIVHIHSIEHVQYQIEEQISPNCIKALKLFIVTPPITITHHWNVSFSWGLNTRWLKKIKRTNGESFFLMFVAWVQWITMFWPWWFVT